MRNIIKTGAVCAGITFLFLVTLTAITEKSKTSATGTAFAEPKFMYVKSQAGLKLRKTPDKNGDVIEVMEKWSKMEVKEVSAAEETIAGSNGRWIKVKHNYSEGWAFSAFLADYSPSGKDLEIVKRLKEITLKLERSDKGYPFPGDNDIKTGDIRGGGGGVCGEFYIYDTVVKDGVIHFGYKHEYTEDGEGTVTEDGECGNITVKTAKECTINGDEILKTAPGGTVTVTSTCSVLWIKKDK